MNEYFNSIILQRTGASALLEKEIIQDLWSGYGKIMRVGLDYPQPILRGEDWT